MNICFFTDIGRLGGGEFWVMNASRLLAARGHNVSVACPYRSEYFAACHKAGMDVHGYFNTAGTPFYEPLFHFLKARNIDVLYCTVVGSMCETRTLEPLINRLNTERASSPAILILKTGLPPVPGLDPEFYGAGSGPAVRRLHVVSDETKAAFLHWQPELDGLERFVQVVREGIPLDRFDPALQDRNEARVRWQILPDQVLITCLARLHSMKGQDNLLLAACDVVRERPEARFIIAGDGDERARLEQLANHLGLNGHVRFAGHVSDVPSLLAATDIFCHPSLADGLPNAVVEAMAMELPVVASRVGGVPEIVADGNTGILVAPHDIRQIGKSLTRLVSDEALRKESGSRARQRVVRDFDLSANTTHFENLLADEVDEFRRNPTQQSAPASVPAQVPLNVLFLMNVLRTGGEETELAILARHLHRGAFHVSVASCWKVDEPAPVLDKLAKLGVPVDTACHGYARLEEKVGYLLHKIRREGIRVVVACQDTLLAYHVFQHLQPEECSLIEHAGIEGEVLRIPKDRTTLAVGVSPKIARRAAGVMPEAKARFIPSMVDPAEFEGHDRAVLRSAYHFGSDCIVAFIGRLDAKKGVGDLIDAAAAILSRRQDVQFLIVGGVDGLQPQTAAALVAKAQPLMDTGRFTFAGARSDVPQILTAVDIVVLPSQGEGMSHVIAEAGAAGRAVIATDDGAAREQLEEGRAGVLAPAGNATALAESIEMLIDNPKLRSELGIRLKARVLREYSAGVVIPQWTVLLTEAASHVRPPAPRATLRVIRNDELPPFPAEIQIETNTACNATCIMCPYPEVSKELPPGRMDQGLYEHILRQCAGERTLWRIEPFLNNEPFTDTRMVDWIALAKKTAPHAMVTVTTNGSLVTPAITNRLIHSGLDGIWFSFNGATKETYESIMGLSFDKVKTNIDYLLSVKPASLRVFTNMIETAPMRGEIADNIRYWQSRGVQSGASPLVNRAGNVANFAELNYQHVASNPVRICELLYHKMYVGYNGDVLLCCMDWRRRVILGNAREQSLRDIWLGEKYQHYRRLHEEGRSRELDLCSTCSYVYT